MTHVLLVRNTLAGWAQRLMDAKVTKCGLMITNFMCQMKECFGVRFIFKFVNIQ